MRLMPASMHVTLLSAAAVVAAVLCGPVAGTAAAQPPVPTFARDVAPIFYARCTTCHRPGQISPMSLLTYKDARPWSRSIRARVAARTMPPWFADDGHRRLMGDRRLTDNELMTILAWVDGGAPEGAPDDLPPMPAHVADDWQIGTADSVFTLPDEVAIPATGSLDVQSFEVATRFTDDKWIRAIEVRPGDQARVHAVTVFARRPRQAGEATGALPSEGSARGMPLAFYASGADPLILPDGMAMRLPAGSLLVFEIHYVANGSPGRDRTRVAMRFAASPPAYEVRTLPVGTTRFLIPSGAPQVSVESRVTFDEPVRIIGVAPHAHRRGRSFRFRVIAEDGRDETILSVPRFNWLWASAYYFAEPIEVAPRTAIEVSAVFDNSAANKANPDPRRAVAAGWDPATEEMMQAYVTFAVPRRH